MEKNKAKANKPGTDPAKPNRTELVFILDRSGSMSGLESDTIGGFNAMIQKQGKTGEVVVTTVLFDDNFELLHDRIPINGISPITDKDYFVGGCTALLDAIGKTIHKIAGVQKHTSEDLRADNVLFVITTDGLENASREFSYEKIREMVEWQKEKYGWEFLFLGANIDAAAAAAKVGINRDRAVDYHADGQGTRLNYREVGKTVRDFCASKPITEDWKKEIDKDFATRGGKGRV